MASVPSFRSFTEWRAYAVNNAEGSLVEPVLQAEEARGTDRGTIYKLMTAHNRHMRSAAKSSLSPQSSETKATRLLVMDGGDSRRIAETDNILTVALGGTLQESIAYALASSESGAAGLPIVKAPTGGSVGVLPGAFIPLAERLSIPETKIVDALIVAAGIGNVIHLRATFAAAEAGCGAEVGAATCMAAGGLAWLCTERASAVESAASLALQNYLGLECSSLAGAVEVPCAYRCAIGSVVAHACASMASAGIEFQIPLDEVIDVMAEVGRALPAGLRETQGAGLARTATGRRLAQIAYDKRRGQLSCLSCNVCPPKGDEAND